MQCADIPTVTVTLFIRQHLFHFRERALCHLTRGFLGAAAYHGSYGSIGPTDHTTDSISSQRVDTSSYSPMSKPSMPVTSAASVGDSIARAAVKQATYRVAVGVNTAGTRW
jgi:hypothetical protein